MTEREAVYALIQRESEARRILCQLAEEEEGSAFSKLLIERVEKEEQALSKVREEIWGLGN